MAITSYFLKLDGIKGESADAKHKDEIDIESWSWGETNAGATASGSGRGAGKVSMSDFNFMMQVNRASTELMKACATGQHIKLATMTGRKAGKDQQEYLVYKFYDILISSYQSSGSSEPAQDSVAFSFVKLEVEYKQQKPDGSLTPGGQFHYDIKANKAY